LANRALDVLELQLGSGDPKAALAAAKYVLQGTQLLGETELHVGGPTTPEGVLLPDLRAEANKELAHKIIKRESLDDILFRSEGNEAEIEKEIEALAQSKLKKALAEAGLS
jgi:hypothetical protein